MTSDPITKFVRRPLDGRQPMPQLVFLGLEVFAGGFAGGNLERNGFGYGEPVTLQADELARVVGQQSHRLDAEVAENLGADAVVTLIGLEAKALVRFDRVETLVLQLVGA